MVKVIKGKRFDGNAWVIGIDGYLKKNLDSVIKRVREKNWDYVSVISGYSGVGKSNFSITLARYCDEKFDEKQIAFTAEDFIRITNECDEFSSVVLDESFASLNTKISNSVAFLRIINHLQLIRQKRLFIFLNLPNFFDLSKGIAIFRSSHLFLVYANTKGDRGFFTVFDREAKKNLYIKGGKFLNYHAVKSNFYGRFSKQKAIDEKVYEKLKRQHLLAQNEQGDSLNKDKLARDKMVTFLVSSKKFKQKEISEMSGLSKKTIYNILNPKQ